MTPADYLLIVSVGAIAIFFAFKLLWFLDLKIPIKGEHRKKKKDKLDGKVLVDVDSYLAREGLIEELRQREEGLLLGSEEWRRKALLLDQKVVSLARLAEELEADVDAIAETNEMLKQQLVNTNRELAEADEIGSALIRLLLAFYEEGKGFVEAAEEMPEEMDNPTIVNLWFQVDEWLSGVEEKV